MKIAIFGLGYVGTVTAAGLLAPVRLAEMATPPSAPPPCTTAAALPLPGDSV